MLPITFVNFVMFIMGISATRYLSMSHIGLVVIIGDLLNNIEKKIEGLNRKAIKNLVLDMAILSLTLIFIQNLSTLPHIYNQSIYDDYWHSFTLKEVGEYIKGCSEESVLIATNAQPVILRYYSNRETFQYLGFSADSQMIALNHIYSFGVINAKYWLDCQSFIHLFKFIVIVSPPQKIPEGATISHTYVPIDDSFRALLNRFYYLKKTFSNYDGEFAELYERKSIITNNITFLNGSELLKAETRRFNWVHKRNSDSYAGVTFLPSNSTSFSSVIGKSSIIEHEGSLVLISTSTMNSSVASGFALMFLNIPFDDNVKICWTWILNKTSEGESTADLSLLVDNLWHPVSFVLRYNELEEKVLNGTDISKIIGFRPRFIQAIQFTNYAKNGCVSRLELRSLKITGPSLKFESTPVLINYYSFPAYSVLPLDIKFDNESYGKLYIEFAEIANRTCFRIWYDGLRSLESITVKKLQLIVGEGSINRGIAGYGGYISQSMLFKGFSENIIFIVSLNPEEKKYTTLEMEIDVAVRGHGKLSYSWSLLVPSSTA
jgi:hypothetical protein